MINAHYIYKIDVSFIKQTFVTHNIHFHFPMNKIFLFIACNLMIILNKQRQEHNNLATIWAQSITQGSPWALQVLPACKNLESKCKSYDNKHGSHEELRAYYVNNGWKNQLDETNTPIIKISSLNFKGPLLYIYLYNIRFNSLFRYTNLWYVSLMYTKYSNTSNNTPSYTHFSSYVVWRVHPLGRICTLVNE